jgi:hypothetical protein
MRSFAVVTAQDEFQIRIAPPSWNRKFDKKLGYETGAQMGSIDEKKTRGRKTGATTYPLYSNSRFHPLQKGFFLILLFVRNV